MEISVVSCDICGRSFPLSTGPSNHFHPEYDIDGTPINIWTPVYPLSKQKYLSVLDDEKGVWKFKNYLPDFFDGTFSLNEGNTPLRYLKDVSLKYSVNVLLKDESKNPTGSFKDRGMPLLMADVKRTGKIFVAIPSTGNAAVSLTTYAQHNYIQPIVFIPKTTPKVKIKKLGKNAKIIFDRDIIESWNHFFSYCKQHQEVYNAFLADNIPYQQGLKTLVFEVFLQLGNRVPDWIIIPCGSGGNIVSQYFAFKDLEQMCLIKKLPKFVSVQITGADPITVGFNNKIVDRVVVLEDMAESKAEGIASDTCFNYFKIINILNETKGRAVSVSDEEIDKVRNSDHLEFSSLSVFAALERLKLYLKKDDQVVLIGTAKEKK